jgi:hypothetical protein
MTIQSTLGLLAAALLPFSGALAADAPVALAETPAGYVKTGETKRCLSTSRIKSMQILNETQILVTVGSNEAYLQQPRSCSRLRKHYAFSYQVHGGQLCDTTSITLLDSGSGLSFSGVCFFDEFQKLEKQSAKAD